MSWFLDHIRRGVPAMPPRTQRLKCIAWPLSPPEHAWIAMVGRGALKRPKCVETCNGTKMLAKVV